MMKKLLLLFMLLFMVSFVVATPNIPDVAWNMSTSVDFLQGITFDANTGGFTDVGCAFGNCSVFNDQYASETSLDTELSNGKSWTLCGYFNRTHASDKLAYFADNNPGGWGFYTYTQNVDLIIRSRIWNEIETTTSMKHFQYEYILHCVIRNNTNTRFFYGNITDYIFDGLTTHTEGNTGTLFIGSRDNANFNWKGQIDEVYYWNNTALSSDVILEVWNNGSFNFYTLDGWTTGVNNFSVSLLNNWTGVNINNFSVVINGSSFSTTSGSIFTNLLRNNSNLFNITYVNDEETFFNKTFFNVNVSSNHVGNVFASVVNVSFKYSNGDLVTTPINLTSLDTSEFFNVTNGFEILFPDAGINNFSVRCNNNIFAPFNFTLNISALDNSSFVFVVNETQNVITFLDANNSNPISNASITVNFPSGYSLDAVTNASGQINFSYIQNDVFEFGNYSYYFDRFGFINISLADVINESNIPHSRSYNLSRAKLNIFIYDRVTRELLDNTTVNVAFIGLFNETTTTGSVVKDNLTIVSGDYIIYASSEGYKTALRSFTFTNQEELTLNFYLLNLTDTNAGTLFVTTKDSFFRDVVGANVDLLEYIPSSLSYVSVDSCISNVNARCSFAVELNTKLYYIRATSIIDNTVFVAETSQSGEIFTINNDVRDLIFFTRTAFSISTSTNLIYRPSETFINNVSSISVDFFTSDGLAKEVCVEYFRLVDDDWVSITGDTYCLFSSNAVQNIDVDVTLNRSNSYEARIVVREGFNNTLKTYVYPDLSSASSVFNNDFKATIIMIFWIFALAFAMHQKNISLFFFLAIIISWVEVILFPTFTIVAVSVFKTIVSLISFYVARKKEDFQ